eukprot:CAMPEP_0180156102 /NCGR_PEP_ID=MMETSP0986-20121125/25328_1 /TAXON_ID=697907 /ORGANISM="non described non described, Strain CCMP2293" /LENGTH=674 /DNA_ID=CAMNT_0022105131 /DNA_START=55 /DNA_END=2079 /DNA_ORIENTATION=-
MGSMVGAVPGGAARLLESFGVGNGRPLHATVLASAGAGAVCFVVVRNQGKVVAVMGQGSAVAAAALEKALDRVAPASLARAKAIWSALQFAWSAPTSTEPPILHMRDELPFSFWDPESPQVPEKIPPPPRGGVDVAAVWTADGWDNAESSDPFGWERSRSAGRRQSARLHEISQKSFSSGVPSGPDGPGKMSPKTAPRNPGRPDWHRMLSESANPGHNPVLKVHHRTSSAERSSSGDLSHEEDDIYPDEMSEVTEEDLQATERCRSRAMAVRSAMANRSLGYADYLQLDKILNAQSPQSTMFSSEVHDEMLFIVIHQAYELWFKQIIFELDSINESLCLSRARKRVSDKTVSVCAVRSGRICEILKVLVQQFSILETMSAQGFNDFRDFLNPASGFQSAQFRKMENKLGMRPAQRVQHSGCPYYRHLAKEEEREEVLDTEREPGLLQHTGAWLETILDDCCAGFNFATFMQDAIEQAAHHDRAAIEQYPRIRQGPMASGASKGGKDQKAEALDELEQKRKAHVKLFDREAHDELVAKGIRHLSFKATMACVFIQTFALELSLQTAHRLVMNLIDIDELIARWRHRHSGLVLRMIGTKSGTGGSSGHAYLSAVQHKSRIFVDLCHASHYLLPQHSMPPLPPAVRARLQRRLGSDDADAFDVSQSAQARNRGKSLH